MPDAVVMRAWVMRVPHVIDEIDEEILRMAERKINLIDIIESIGNA
jgi:hypothetical protein